MFFSIGINFLLKIKKIVRKNLDKGLSKSDYTKVETYLTKYRFYVYIGFFSLVLNLILLRFN